MIPKAEDIIREHLKANIALERLNSLFDSFNKVVKYYNFNNKKTLMTDEEILAVVTAHKEGKKIQYREKNSCKTWVLSGPCPSWNFDLFEYRVKPEPKVRPYGNAQEFLEASKKHGPYITWNISSDKFYCPVEINNDGIQVECGFAMRYPYNSLHHKVCWQDGHPCGVILE